MKKIYDLRDNEEIKVKNGKVYVKEKSIMDWAKPIYRKFRKDFNARFDYTGNVTIIYDMKTKKVGFATCCEEDEYSAIIGIAIAYCRLRNLPIPKEVFE